MERLFTYLCISIIISFINWNEIHAGTQVLLDGSQQEKDLTIDIIESNVSLHKIRVSIHGFHDNIIKERGKEYHHLSINDIHGSELLNVGEPQLPTIRQFIAIPSDAEYDISISEEKWEEVEMGTIFPAQMDSKGNEPAPGFVINDSVYHQICYAPVLLKWSNESKLNNIRCLGLRVCPFKYYPLRGKLSVLKEFSLQINFSKSSERTTVKPRDIKKAIGMKIFDNDISGFPVTKNMEETSRNTDYYDYLIIVGDTTSGILESQALKDFTKWKAFMGFKTKVVSTAVTGTTTASIKNYITQEYNNYDIMYALFIGDQDKIPLKTLSITTDYLEYSHGDFWYGCLGGDDDFLAEVAIGRFSTNTLSDFQKMVDKTIAYERFYNGNSKNVLLVAHKQAPNNIDFYQACSDTIKSRYSGIMSFSTAYGASGAKNSDVVNHINSGMNIVNYNGHGDKSNWIEWNNTLQYFGSIQIDSIDNTSVFFSTGCKNGDIREEPCMMETLTRSTKGAVACLSAVDNVWRIACNKYDQQLFWQFLIGHYRYLGDLNLMAQVSTIENYYFTDEKLKNKALFNARSFLCGGDPTLRLWTDGPYSLTSSGVYYTFYDDYMSLYVTPFAEYEISIVSELGELLERIKVYSHSKLISIPSGNFYVVINKPDYYPYIMFFSSSNYIQNETVYANSYYYYNNTPLSIGYNVTPNKPYGNVTVKSGSKLSIHNGTGGVTISNGFECEKGGELIVE